MIHCETLSWEDLTTEDFPTSGETALPVRRSTRARTRPTRIEDYVVDYKTSLRKDVCAHEQWTIRVCSVVVLSQS